MNVVALTKIVTWLCDVYLSLLICSGNYEMFLIMQLNLNCRSFRRTSNNSSKEEPKLPRSDTPWRNKELQKKKLVIRAADFQLIFGQLYKEYE